MSWKNKLRDLFGQKAEYDREALESHLFAADFPFHMVEQMLATLADTRPASSAEALASLQREIERLASACVGDPFCFSKLSRPFVLMLVGVNGVGKTSTAGKLAVRAKQEGCPVLLAAADTFRAGAVDQLRLWGERIGVDVIHQGMGADPAAVAFDAYQRAVQQNAVLIIDTAGRMHTRQPLMEQVNKIKRVLARDADGVMPETWLVLDASLGQNALIQSREFHAMLELTGLVLTKLDGSAKGGAALASALDWNLPIRFIGLGESATDLAPFSAQRFSQEIIGL